MPMRISESNDVFLNENQPGYSVWLEYQEALAQCKCPFLVHEDGHIMQFFQLLPQIIFSQTKQIFPPGYLDLMDLSIQPLRDFNFSPLKQVDVLKGKSLLHRTLKRAERKVAP